MFKNIKWLRLTPDRAGRGGIKTGIHSFQQQPVNDTSFLSGGHVYRGRWRRDFDSIADTNAGQFEVNSQTPLALHGYVYPSLTDPAATPGITVFSHHNLNGVANRVWDQTVGVLRSTRPTNNTQAGVFQNVNGRCFFGDGAAESMIFDDRVPAIHAQKNQPLGIGTPQQALPNTGGSVTASGTGYVFGQPNGVGVSPYINHPDPNNQLGTILATDYVAPSIIDPNYLGIYSGAVMAQGNPVFDATTTNTTPFLTPGTGISITTGTSLVTLVGGTWPANFQYAGLAINFNGYSFVVMAHGPIGVTNGRDLNGNAIALSNIAPNAQMLILGVYDGPTIVNVPYTITGCQVQMPTNNTLTTVETNLIATPPGVAQGYSQMTASNLVQIKVDATRVNGYARNLGNISLGPEAAEEASGGSIQSISDANLADGRRRLTSVSDPFAESDAGAPIAVDGAGPTGGVLITTIDAVVASDVVRLVDPNISGNNLVGVQAWWGGDATISDGVMVIATATLTSASNPFSPGDVGQPIVVENATAFGTSLITTVAAYVSAGQVTLSAPSAVGVTNARVWWRGLSTQTHAGPTYAYAWYDPETGHASNISPMYQIPRPTSLGAFTDFANITPIFQIDPGFISYPTGVDALRFSHILFFRTLSAPGSSTLYPIGSLNPFVGKVHPASVSTRGSWSPSTYRGWMGLPNNYTAAPPIVAAPNYWYDWSSDSDLLLSGGFRAPQFTNEKPMATLRGGIVEPGKPYAIQYWDRRTWVVNTQEPTKIAFSCDEAQCPLGVPEESFPATNYLRLPSADARVTALRVVGDLLLVTTNRFSYIVAGNNESNYRLMKISSSMPGVGYYQMSEMPTVSGAEGEPSTLYYLGQDRIVYRWTIGGQPVPISLPIQNFLDTALSQGASSLATYRLCRVHCVSAWGRKLVIVQVPDLPAQFNIYDVENQVWSFSFPTDGTGVVHLFGAPTPMTTVYGMGVPINELFSGRTPTIGAVIVRSWLRDDTGVSTVPLYLETFPLNFDGQKTRKQIVGANLHATAITGTYQLISQVNEDLNQQRVAIFGAYPDPLDSIYGANPSPYDGTTARDLVVMTAQFDSTNGMPLVGYRFRFFVQILTATDPAQIFALDIAYVDAEATGDGSP